MRIFNSLLVTFAVLMAIISALPRYACSETDSGKEMESATIEANSSQTAKNKSDLERATKLYNAGKYAEALKHFQIIANSNSDDGNARIMCGYCFYNMKTYNAALKEYGKAAREGKLVSIRNKA